MVKTTIRSLQQVGLLVGFILLVSGFSTDLRSQQTPTGRPPIGLDGLPPIGADLPPAQKEKQAKAQNDERQKQLVADTEKLLELATQLHADVAKTDKNLLSLDVIKRADEIERLAHLVKVKMKG